MKLHKNAALTVAQRKKVKALFESGASVAQLAGQFQVHETTIRRWIKRTSPYDKTGTTRPKRVVPPAYEQAVIAYRQAHPTAGPIPIALALQAEFACAHRGTVTLILQRAGRTRKTTARAKPKWRIPVGRHRLQGDVQQLPAIQGQRGFEYKISFIHLATRWKYSEIQADCTSQTVAAVYQRALDALPPFITFTDNAMYYTMRFTAHPERQTAFTKTVEQDGRIHALIKKASPWRNGIIERSNRTDNEACFSQHRFTCSEERRYQHRLWEMHYNCQRPHQGLGNQTPLQVYKELYPLHSRSRMLT